MSSCWPPGTKYRLTAASSPPSALAIDESALTGESVPADKDATTLGVGDLAPGEQSNMVFMHTPVTHGSAVMVVTGTGRRHGDGEDRPHARPRPQQKRPR